MSESVIWKYLLTGEAAHEIPTGGEVVHVGLDPHGAPSMWVRVQRSQTSESRLFRIVGTGHPFPSDWIVLGSFVDGPFVWHVAEVPA